MLWPSTFAYDQKIEILWQYLRQRNFNRIVYRPHTHTPVPVQRRDFFLALFHRLRFLCCARIRNDGDAAIAIAANDFAARVTAVIDRVQCA